MHRLVSKPEGKMWNLLAENNVKALNLFWIIWINVNVYYTMPTEKTNINIVVIGDENSQMSYVIGHIVGKGGITSNINPWKFETSKYYITITGAEYQGHGNFIKNMVTGTSQADCALFIISAKTGEFEATFSENGKNLARLAFSLGVKQLIIGVNNMDNTEPPYSEDRFNEIIKEMTIYIKNIGYNPSTVPFVPISGYLGENLMSQSNKMPWYRGWSIKHEKEIKGLTLFEALDTILPPTSLADKPLRIPISYVKMEDIGTVAVGRVESGTLKPGDVCTLAPSGLTSEVKSVQINNKTMSYALPGEDVEFNVENIPFEQIRRGDVAGDSNNDPPKACESFLAEIIVLDHPGEILIGYNPVVHVHTANMVCKFAELKEKINIYSGKTLEYNPKSIRGGEAAIVRLIPSKPICVESFSVFPSLGRFTVHTKNQIVAVGIIKEVTKK